MSIAVRGVGYINNIDQRQVDAMDRGPDQALTVLCVEHDDDHRVIINLALQLDSQITVLCAGSAEEASCLTRERKPIDLALVDSEDVLAAWRTHDRASATDERAIPMILMAADMRIFRNYEAIGAVGAILKPFDPLRLAIDIRNALKRFAA